MSKMVILALFMLVVLIRVISFYSSKPQLKPGDHLTLTTTLFSEPTISHGKQSFFINNIYITLPAYPELHYGDSLKVSGTLKVVSPTSDQGSARPLILLDTPTVIITPTIESSVLRPFRTVRDHIRESFSRVLPQKEAGLLLGIVFGIKDSLPKNFSEQLTKTGTLHVVAASGMNVTMVGGFLLALSTLYLSRRIAMLTTISGLLFYAVLSGLEPSIIRATIMGIFSYSALALGRQNYSFLALFIACATMAFIDPNNLSSVSFQLSAGSAAGIIGFKPIFDTFFTKMRHFVLFDDLSSTISAQIGSLPILILGFSQYSLYSIVVNMLILWTIPILMILGSIAATGSFIFSPVAAVSLFLCYPFLVLVEWVIAFFSGFGGLLSITMSWPIVMGYYSLLAASVVFFEKRRRISNTHES